MKALTASETAVFSAYKAVVAKAGTPKVTVALRQLSEATGYSTAHCDRIRQRLVAMGLMRRVGVSSPWRVEVL